MKTKYTAKLLIGAATISLATFISHGNAHASEQTTGLAPAQPVNFDSINVTPDQKTFYQVLHMEGISEDQREQYLKQLHEDPSSAQNVFSESIKDAIHPERRVAQQNAFYSVLHNDDLSEEQRDAYIGRIKEDPDQSQEVFVESLNVAPKAESHEDRLIELQNKNLMEANEALKALQQEDSIQNRRAAQRAVNKLTPDSANAFQKELDQINAPRDAKIKADAEAKKQAPEVSAPQIEDAPTTEVAPSPKQDMPKIDKKEEDKVESDTEVKEAPKADTEKKSQSKDTSKTEQAKETPKVEQSPKTEKAEEAPKAETPQNGNKAQTEEAKPEVKDNVKNTPSAPVLPETGEATTSTLESYWNSFKDSVNKGYTYVKNSITSGFQSLKEKYNYITGKYNDVKYYTELYKNHKNLIDVTVLGFLNENGISAHITPLKINEKDNLLSKSYAHTRNFVTESINTGKVLYTLYKNPTVLNTAIKAAETANTAKNLFNGFLSFFK
ncbi:TPA: IgG-binding protein SBI [Staphylococcus pseudintermedius]|uniref:Immunoglobulin-binding protein Sbi n=1 Tax=Staphylococcus pseudintermedius TaxID=283734 RepID=A0A317YQH1_STAPS|nr:Ig-binding surface protein Sbi/SpsK [Staphylococcus pseudintermedius]EGQ4158843.1 IgG-binding protein SBI [Staphylococcus pseudintermedius]EII6320067.1 B domain-containing protein [Staphylococcus pseudintermedius]MDE9803614.1 Ig-binding surface protein Sbi/SpsK [Staphylococcus pseudintermedius]MDE9822103.1 Ig-binding surface protein Sbi/SpsK [Staphylococcus pseudintermedius]MDE9826789.1 Ig-binding surface protein Sbi/SpsK [Staphylococcus pseudintermedius]